MNIKETQRKRMSNTRPRGPEREVTRRHESSSTRTSRVEGRREEE